MSGALPTKTVEKPWGQDRLPQPFSTPAGQRIGEIWFEPPPAMPQLLVKYLFTGEALSVQVHPSEAQAPSGSHGKEECWLIVDAEPGARVAVGLRRAVDPDALRDAALDGSIEELLEWHPVAAGDFLYLPAGTVHAIGAGITLIEVQQNSDVTYRLFDYGRPRPLHLDQGLAVARLVPHDPKLRRHLPETGETTLVEGPHFRLDRLDGAPSASAMARYGERPVLVVPIDGPVKLGNEPLAPGSCGLALRLADVALGTARTLIAQPA